MVSSLLVDALADPCAVLESLYDDFKKGENDAASDFPSLVAKHFANVFESNDALNQVRSSAVFHHVRLIKFP